MSDQSHYSEGHADDDILDNLPDEGEATPQYESDPENSCVESTTLQVQGRSWIPTEDEMTWEMQSNRGMGSRSRRYPRGPRSRHRHDIEEQSSIGDGMNKYGAQKGRNSDAGVIVIPHIPRVPPSRPMVGDDSSLSRPSSVIHPYVSDV